MNITMVTCTTSIGRRNGEESIGQRETPLPSEPERVECALVIHRTRDGLQTEAINNTQEVVQRPRERCVLTCMHRRY